MRRQLATACFWVLCFAATEARSQKVHAIIAADSLDGQIGPGIRENVTNMNGLLASLEIVGEIVVLKAEVTGQDFSCKSILQAVDKLQVGPDDAVLFYYAGHGAGSKSSKFPDFSCEPTSEQERIGLSTIEKRISRKKPKPRFVLAIADACNVLEGPAAGPGPQFTPPPVPERKIALRRLFLDYNGSLTMSGSITGQYAWYMNRGETVGGFFTIQFLRAINQQISEKRAKVRWEDIVPIAKKMIMVPTKPRETKQQPQVELLANQKPQ
jgi:hypothetical protein